MTKIDEDASKLVGAYPYNTGSNLTFGDGYFAKDRERHYGTKKWREAIERAEARKQTEQEALRRLHQ